MSKPSDFPFPECTKCVHYHRRFRDEDLNWYMPECSVFTDPDRWKLKYPGVRGDCRAVAAKDGG
jgi:hypothetical protein